MENLFLSVTTHMKSKWMPLRVFSPPPARPAKPTGQGDLCLQLLGRATAPALHPSTHRAGLWFPGGRDPLQLTGRAQFTPLLPRPARAQRMVGRNRRGPGSQYGQPSQPLPRPHKDSGVGRLPSLRSGSFQTRQGPASVICMELLVRSSFRLGQFIFFNGQ